jgi:hypothetical protein
MKKFYDMNELLINIKTQIIAQIRASKIKRINVDFLNLLLDGFRIWTDDNRILTKDEKSLLLDELSNYFIADLNYETDLVQIERGLVIIDHDPKMHTVWDIETSKRFYWRKQREFLMSVLALKNGSEEASRIINSIDFETDEILRNMENPLRKEFDSRGLVVGYVQSGKTANFTALISKAADAGYRFIIVFAGIHDELRQQTQIRIDRELSGHNNLNLDGDFIEWNDYESARRWRSLTSAGYLDGKETGEFSGKGIYKFKDEFLSKEKPVIAIVKKNVRIMDRLIKWIANSDENDRINVPVLIIDDEADQASVDGNATKDDTDPTKTNARIRQIIELFKRSAYVGYTATPFANVFIKHDSEHEDLGDDLYPRNYIHSLPEPRGYFGTKRIFNDNLDELFVKTVKNSKSEKKELADKGNITSDLVTSIYSFIIGISIRKLRGQKDMPMSMMINVDHRVNKMNRIGEVIVDYLKTLSKYVNSDSVGEAYDYFINDSILLDNKLNTKNSFFSKESVVDEAIKIIKSKELKVRVLNSSNEDKLDYAKEPSMKVIAVGGNKLSRGLTLEGLMTTFYLRESKQFDTLLQMGRWFGYRKGYEDLVRIYTSQTLWRQFKDLAIVELEFRESIKDMVEEGKTPKEFAIGVRQILGLLPTSRNRLGAAVLENYYGGSQVSVTRLPLEHPKLIDENVLATRKLIENIYTKKIPFSKRGKNDLPTILANDVPNELIFDYLTNFYVATDVDGSSLEFDKESLLKYINKCISNNMFQHWNVAIISVGQNTDNTIISLPCNINVRAINRSRLKTSSINGCYNIKAVSSKSDRKIDLAENAVNEYDGRVKPLLLIYFISRSSKPQLEQPEPSREALYLRISADKHREPVSYSIIFPTDNDAPGRFIQNI